MEQSILFVGIEVDDNAFHVALRGTAGEQYEFRCRPVGGELIKKLSKYSEKGYELRCCYEATYVAFSLYRGMQKHGYHCEVIASSSIPRAAGPRVKTDKIDCRKLAEFYMKGLLTMVRVPDEQDETVRGLIRSRNFLAKQLRSTKAHLQLLVRTQGWSFRQEVENKVAHYWTPKHWRWLDSKVANAKDPAFKVNMLWLLESIRSQESKIEVYDTEIDKWAKAERYKKSVQGLRCYRGIDTLTAMIIKTEIGDANRFTHPMQLTSFSGMDVAEYSSGGKEKKFRITKMGNRHLRTATVEACQTAGKPPRVFTDLKRRRQGVDPRYIQIADRCMNRLYKKATRLRYREKQPNKIKVACAREMLGFIWETLKVAS